MPDDRARGHVSVIIHPMGKEWLALTAVRLKSNRSKLLRAKPSMFLPQPSPRSVIMAYGAAPIAPREADRHCRPL